MKALNWSMEKARMIAANLNPRNYWSRSQQPTGKTLTTIEVPFRPPGKTVKAVKPKATGLRPVRNRDYRIPAHACATDVVVRFPFGGKRGWARGTVSAVKDGRAKITSIIRVGVGNEPDRPIASSITRKIAVS